jgi:RHS repeat-associated protein
MPVCRDDHKTLSRHTTNAFILKIASLLRSLHKPIAIPKQIPIFGQLISSQTYHKNSYRNSHLSHPTFGMQVEHRSWSSGDGYRFGFNGKESDNEVSGSGNSYDYGFRIYNPRLGKFLSVDPLFKSYPWYTPYQFAGNMPIAAIDLDGLEEWIVIYWYKDGKATGSSIIAINNAADRVSNDKGGFYINVDESKKMSRESLLDKNAWKDIAFDKEKDGYKLKEGTEISEEFNNSVDQGYYSGQGGIKFMMDNAVTEIGLRTRTIKFKQNSDELFEVGDNERFIAGAKNFLDANPDYKFNVAGFASVEGDEEDNQQLSLDRALKFKKFLVDNGIDADRIIAEGKGEIGGDTEESKQANRKVELTPVLSPDES